MESVLKEQPDAPISRLMEGRKVPVNLRQSGNPDIQMLISTRVRKSPFFHKSVEHGCWAVTVYNKMYHPRAYFQNDADGLLGEYHYLCNHVTMWNVAVERQIQIKGPDALAFTDLLVTRDLTKKAPVNQARYVILCDENGGIINDPVLLRVDEDEFWLSISDSDVLLWAKGLNYKMGYNVEINEIDVAPVQIQGPKSKPLMKKLFGDKIEELKYYKLWQTKLKDMDVVISRTGFSGEVGYEIYLKNATVRADDMWDEVWNAGQEFDLRIIAPCHIRRLEAGILSYNQDMDIECNPFEVNLDWQVDFEKEDYVGKEALKKISQQGVKRKLVGLSFGGPRVVWYNSDFWLVKDEKGEQPLGYVTSAFYSPKLGTNIALAMMPIEHTAKGTKLSVHHPELPEAGEAVITDVPFFDPEKIIPAS